MPPPSARRNSTAETPEGRSVEEQYDARQKAAAERLAQIRQSMHTDEDAQ